jgi:hypothetical protein
MNTLKNFYLLFLLSIFCLVQHSNATDPENPTLVPETESYQEVDRRIFQYLTSSNDENIEIPIDRVIRRCMQTHGFNPYPIRNQPNQGGSSTIRIIRQPHQPTSASTSHTPSGEEPAL